MKIIHHTIFLLIIATLSSCDTRSPEEISLTHLIETARQQKDLAFKSDPASPLKPGERDIFRGLNYYPVDLDLRFEGPIVPYDTLIADTILGTRGDKRPAIKYGYFEFAHQGSKHRLQVYRMLRNGLGSKDYFFLGFTDATTGEETYGGGRYIDLPENTVENNYVVDFNNAYNPYCVYNPTYSCAIPSRENRLRFAVSAGEKDYKPTH